MATKKTATKALVPGKAPANNLPTAPWRDSIKTATNTSLAKGVAGTDFAAISLQGGRIRYRDTDLGNSIEVVIIATLASRAWYSSGFQPNNITPPDCYSFDMESPHPASGDKQSASCAECELNQFGTAENGKGKACKEGYRIALMHADAVRKGASKIAAADIPSLRLSVSASKTFGKFLAGLASRYDGIPFAVIALLEVEPDSKFQYAASWSVVEELDADTVEALGGRFEESLRMLTSPYPVLTEDQKKKAPAPRRGNKAPVRRTKY